MGASPQLPRLETASDCAIVDKMSIHRVIASLGLFMAAVACGEQSDQAKQTAEIAKQAADAAKSANEAAAQAAAAGDANAAAINAANAATAAGSAQMAQAMQAIAQTGQVEGPVVNWKQLVEFVPDKLGDFAAKGDADGKTTKMGQMEITVVKRRYEAGERRLKLTISDTVFAPMMRMPFNMAAMVQEDSSDGFKKGTRISDQPAIVEWKSKSGRSRATLLVGGRYLTEVEIDDTQDPNDAENLAKTLRLSDLAAVKPSSG